MNYLSNEQIQSHEMLVTNCKDYFKISFISRRLKKLMCKKIINKQWEVAQIPVKSVFDYYNFESVFVSPSKGTVLFCKKATKYIKFKFTDGTWATSRDF